jgi:xylulokinase
MRHFLSVDLGTSAVKVALFDETGARLGLAIEEYPLLTPAEDFCEVPAPTFWDKFKSGLVKVLAESNVAPDAIVAVGFSSQGETFVPVDRSGQPLCNAISWLDNRASAGADQLAEQFTRAEVYHTTGQPDIAPIWPAAKMLWLRQNAPKVFTDAHKYLMAEDYLIYRLSGEFASEHSVYSSSLLLDIHTREWWPAMLGFVGVGPEHLPTLSPSGTVVGKISQVAAKETGLSTDTLVVTGAYDHAAGSVGAGVVHPGLMSETTGSSMAICAPIDAPMFDPQMRVPCHCHAIDSKYFLSPWGETAGMVLKWFRDGFGQSEIAEAGENGAFELLGQLAAEVPAGSDGLLMLPFLAGTGCPEMDADAKGVFYGMTLQHGKGHFVRSIMEAVTYMIARNVQIMRELGMEVSEIRSLGGGARSDLWCQIKADAMNVRVAVVEETEQALKGAAILAGVGAGAFTDLESASKDMVAIRKTYEPNGANAAVYAAGRKKYEALYEALKPMFRS